MKIPEGYQEVKAATGEGFKRLPPGNYVCRINSAFSSLTKNGQEQLVILFDICEGEHKGFYKEQYDSKAAKDVNANWPGVYRQLVLDKDGKTSPYFKGVVTAIEESNKFTWDFNEDALKGKLFGGCFGEEEFVANDGKLKSTVRLRWIRSVESIKNMPVLEVKRVKQQPSAMDGFAPQDDVPNF